MITRYTLIHEIGHYFGLCHYGHSGVQNIMFTAPSENPSAELSWFDWGELNYLADNEPRFTLEDGKNGVFALSGDGGSGVIECAAFAA